MMRKVLLIIILGLFQATHAQETPDPVTQQNLQESRDMTWEANRELKEDRFVSAEAKYRRAISKSGGNAVAPYNLGNALYEKENYNEAFGRFKEAGEAAAGKPEKHKAYHNMGNVFMKNKEYEKAVEAYKEALRNDPSDEETRYNLALAKEMLKKEQNENQNNEDKENQDQKDQNQDQQNQGDKENEDKQQQNQDQQEDKGDQGDQQQEENKEGEGEEKQEQQQQPEPGEEDDPRQQPRPNQLSPQQIQNLLEAMQNEERKVQEKLDAQKVKGAPTKSKKDW